MTKDEQIKALTERLESCFRVIDEATDVIAQWFPNEEDRGDIYIELACELAPIEELLSVIAEAELDLFEHYEKQPKKLQKILEGIELDGLTYEQCEELLTEVEELGYTFQYGLDALPHSLIKL